GLDPRAVAGICLPGPAGWCAVRAGGLPAAIGVARGDRDLRPAAAGRGRAAVPLRRRAVDGHAAGGGLRLRDGGRRALAQRPAAGGGCSIRPRCRYTSSGGASLTLAAPPVTMRASPSASGST